MDKKNAPSVLPVPAPLLAHHAKLLEPLMEQWRDQKRMPPVLLLTGPAGIGKRPIAYHLAQWLLCDSSGFSEDRESGEEPGLFGAPAPPAPAGKAQGRPAPCGTCVSCQKALHGTWVDFREIAADPEEGETLKIDQFRELKSSQGFGAFDGKFRITLIRDADRMTPQAANSVLKLLEEPPPGWVFFLTASDASLLLPTLVSRCQTIRLAPLPESAVQELLSLAGVPPDQRAACARLAQGSYARALALADEEARDARKSIARFLEHPAEELNALVDWASQEPAHLSLLLDQLELALAERIRGSAVSASGGPGSKPDARLAEWIERSERLFRARAEATLPLNRKLLVQDLLIPWLERP